MCKPLSARFHAPQNGVLLTFEIHGKKLLAEMGMKNVGTNDKHLSRSSLDYHNYLMGADAYSKPFEYLFPKNNYEFDLVFILDLWHMTFTELTDLVVTCVYDANSSPEGYYLGSITCSQNLFSYKDRHMLKTEVLP
jgi:hypothetical protein